MKAFVLAAVLVAAAACGAYQFPGGPSTPSAADGTVSGRVLSVPCAPVEQAGSTCAGRPVANLEIDYVNGATPAGKAVTDSNGDYSVALAPGSYGVRMKTYMRVISGPLTISVSAGSNQVANYTLDNGIRAPVPQQ
jgi:hypothetical protein